MSKTLNKSQQDRIYEECEIIIETYAAAISSLRGSRILLSGGTGFFGKWLLYTLRTLNLRHNAGIQASIITRAPSTFLSIHPDLSCPEFQYIKGDVRNLEIGAGPFNFAIHAATEASAKLNSEQPDEMFDVNVQGTKNFLRNCANAGVQRVLITSSGAVYGQQSQEITNQPEDFQTGPEPLSCNSAYSEGKRVSEFLGALHASKTKQIVNIARCYAFLGPFLPLDTHFAAGNFINDCIHGRAITLRGDGSTVRSYQHPIDLIGWLLTILTRGTGTAYNTGSERGASTLELAQLISQESKKLVGQSVPVQVLGKSAPDQKLDRYVPSTEKARRELGLKTSIDLEETIRRTLTWHLQRD
jgi:dTDP-glucose 4,6-dehydratase